MLDRLVIGTANFGKEYNGYKVPDDEIKRIWDYCREVGIDTVDTAVAYGDIEIPSDFKVITKIRYGDIVYLPGYHAVLAHDKCSYSTVACISCYCRIGVSIYEIEDMPDFPVDIVQLPYIPLKHELKELKEDGIEIHARKVFADDCFVDAIRDKYVDKIVIGIDNLGQLKENVEVLRKEKS